MSKSSRVLLLAINLTTHGRPDTRDIIQNVYIRKVEKKDGEPWAIEFATFEAVKDPLHQAAK
jgi:hypothetical protein